MINVEDRAIALARLVSLCEPYAEPSLGSPGAYQVETAKVVGTITLAGNATVIVIADGITGGTKTLQVPVALNDTDSQVATKIRAFLAADAVVNGFFEILGTGVNVQIKTRAFDSNDASMNLSIANGTCTGLTNAFTSVNTTPGSLPSLTELEAILDANLIAKTWQASTAYAKGVYVYPTTRNDRKYLVVTAGISSSTEPTFPTVRDGTVIDNTVTFKEDGVEFEIGYDIYQAAYEGWDKKSAKASQFMSTPGLDMASIFKRCIEMRDSFEQVCIA